MDFRIVKNETQAEVTLSGKLTFEDAIQYKSILALAEDKAVRSIVLDFRGVTFIDSAGLGMLMVLYNLADRAGRRVSLRGATGQVDKIFQLSQFYDVFDGVEGRKT